MGGGLLPQESWAGAVGACRAPAHVLFLGRWSGNLNRFSKGGEGTPDPIKSSTTGLDASHFPRVGFDSVCVCAEMVIFDCLLVLSSSSMNML